MQLLNKKSQEYSEVKATIWISRGEHFFFQCLDTFTPEETMGSNLQNNILCQMDSLRVRYPHSDNTNIKVKPLYCDSKSAQQLIGSQIDNANDFSKACVKIPINPDDLEDDYDEWSLGADFEEDDPKDQEMSTSKPIIYVKHPGFYFNVTKEMSFENLIFDASETFSKITDVKQTCVKYASGSDFCYFINQEVETMFWPEKQCALAYEDAEGTLQENGRLASETSLLDFYDEKSPQKGYGYFKLKPLINSPEYMQKEIGQLTSISGQIYVTEVFTNGSGTIGQASFYFQESVDGQSYDRSLISFNKVNISSNLLNQSQNPEQLYFENAYYDETSRTFSGEINWVDNAYDGDSLWKYSMTFSEDFLTIESGTREGFDSSGASTSTLNFGTDLQYQHFNPNTVWVQSCDYTGSRPASYNDGFSFDDLLAGLEPDFEQRTLDFPKTQDTSKAREFYNSSSKIYTSEKFNQFTKSKKTGEIYSLTRRSVLFNLYAFIKQDSFQDLDQGYQIPTLNLHGVEIVNFLDDYDSLIYVENDNYIFRNTQLFLHGDPDVSASITITDSNFKDSSFSQGMISFSRVDKFLHSFFNEGIYTKITGFYDFKMNQQVEEKNYEASGQKIVIKNSIFNNLNYGQQIHALSSSDPKKSLFSRPQGLILSLEKFNGPIELSGNTIKNTHSFIPSAIFSNLPIKLASTMSEEQKQDLLENPELNINKYQFIAQEKVMQTGRDETLGELFRSQISVKNGSEVTGGEIDEVGEYLEMTKNFTEFQGVHQQFKRDVHFMNVFDPQDMDLVNEFHVQSPILIKDLQADGNYVIFENNTFESNIGMFGGAIHIHQSKEGDLPVVMKNNIFKKNMAYFSGNAVYCRGIQTMLSLNETYSQNYGLSKGMGGALHIKGRKELTSPQQLPEPTPTFDEITITYNNASEVPSTTTLNLSQIQVKDSNFENNWGGQLAAAINLLDLENKEVSILNCQFLNNSGAFSVLEENFKMPFFSQLTNGSHRLNYYSESYQQIDDTTDGNPDENLADDLTRRRYLQDVSEGDQVTDDEQTGDPDTNTETQDDSQDSTSPSPEPDTPQNTVCRNEIQHIGTCQFGPNLESRLLINTPMTKGVIYVSNTIQVTIKDSLFRRNDPGPVLEDRMMKSNGFGPRASAIFFNNELLKGSIENCTFQENQNDWVKDEIEKQNSDLAQFFPAKYFASSQVPLINIRLGDYLGKDMETAFTISIKNNTFSDQINYQQLGFDLDKVSDIGYKGALLDINQVGPNLNILIEDNFIFNFQFFGPESSLISLQDKGNLKVKNNHFQNIGYLSDNCSVDIPLIYDESKISFDFAAQLLQERQDFGVFFVSNKGLKKDQYHLFESNTFQNIYTWQASVYKFAGDYQDIRIKLKSNFYKNIYSSLSGIFDIQITNEIFLFDEFDINKVGLVDLEDETITDCWVQSDSVTGIIKAKTRENYLTFIIKNSKFNNNTGTLAFMDSASVYISDCEFDSQMDAEVTKFKDLVVNDFFDEATQQIQSKVVEVNKADFISLEYEQSWSEEIGSNKVLYAIDSTNKWKQKFSQTLQNQDQVTTLYFEEATTISDLFEGFEVSDQSMQPSSQIVNCEFKNLAGDGSVIQLVGNSDLYVNKVLATNIQSRFYSLSNSDLTISNSTHKNFQFDKEGGLLLVNPGNAVIKDCFIYDGESASGQIYASGFTSNVDIINTVFSGNRATVNSAILFSITNLDGSISIQDSQILDSESEANIVSLTDTQMVVKNTKFYRNFARTLSNGFSLKSSDLTIDSIDVDNTLGDGAEEGEYENECGFLCLNFQSNLQVENSNFQNIKAESAALASITGESQIHMKNSKMTNFKQVDSAAFLIGMQAISNSSFENVQFTNIILENVINSQMATFQMKDSQITHEDQSDVQLQNTAIFLMDSKVEFDNIVVSNINSIYFERAGAGIVSRGESDILIQNSQFSNLYALRGGAMMVHQAERLVIKNTLFENNLAFLGGALHIGSISYMLSEDNTFEGNSATYFGEPEQGLYDYEVYMENIEYFRGGAIYFECQNDIPGDDCSEEGTSKSNLKGTEDDEIICDCNFFMRGQNVFKDNYAIHDGGAVQEMSKIIDFVDEPTWENNQALYGPDQGKYAVKMEVFYMLASDETPEWKKIVANKHPQSDDNVIVIPSGQNIQIKIVLYDEYNQTISTDNTTTASVIFFKEVQNVRRVLEQMGEDNDPSFIDYNWQTPADFHPHRFLKESEVQIINSLIRCEMGTCNSDELMIRTPPLSQILINITVHQLDTNRQEKQIDFPFTFKAESRSCKAGESYTRSGECVPCIFGYYLLSAPIREMDCKICDKNAICFGENLMAPKDEYYRVSEHSDQFNECQRTESCLKGDEQNPIGICAEGYQGIMCGKCEDGWRSLELMECEKCPSWKKTQILFVVRLFNIFALIFILTRNNFINVRNEQPIIQTMLRVIISHVGFLQIITNVQYRYPKAIKDCLQFQAYILTFFTQLISFECYSMGKEIEHDDSKPHLWTNLRLATAMPFITTGVFFVIYFIQEKLRKKSDRERVSKTEVMDKTICALVCSMWVFYPEVCSLVLKSVVCMKIEDEQRLFADLGIVCWEQSHKDMVMKTALPAFLIIIVGFPLTAYIMMKWNIEKLQLVEHLNNLPLIDQDLIIQVKLRYGFLFNGYNYETFYWELFIMLRKVFILLAYHFFITISSETQILMMILIMIFSILVTKQYEPFFENLMNDLEITSQIVILMFIYFGMYYVTGFHYEYMDITERPWILYVSLPLIFFPNILYLLYYLYQLRERILIVFARRGQENYFKYLSCGGTFLNCRKQKGPFCCRKMTLKEFQDENNIQIQFVAETSKAEKKRQDSLQKKQEAKQPDLENKSEKELKLQRLKTIQSQRSAPGTQRSQHFNFDWSQLNNMSDEQITQVEQLTALEDFYDKLKDDYKRSQEKVMNCLPDKKDVKNKFKQASSFEQSSRQQFIKLKMAEFKEEWRKLNKRKRAILEEENITKDQVPLVLKQFNPFDANDDGNQVTQDSLVESFVEDKGQNVSTVKKAQKGADAQKGPINIKQFVQKDSVNDNSKKQPQNGIDKKTGKSSKKKSGGDQSQKMAFEKDKSSKQKKSKNNADQGDEDKVSEYSVDPKEIEMQAIDNSELQAINKQNQIINKSSQKNKKEKSKRGIKNTGIAEYLDDDIPEKLQTENMESGSSRSSEVRAYNEIQKNDRLSNVTPPRARPKNVPEVNMGVVLSSQKRKESRKKK